MTELLAFVEKHYTAIMFLIFLACCVRVKVKLNWEDWE